MINLTTRVTSTFSPSKIDRNLRFGVIRGLTQTATESQAAVQGALRGAFTLRGKWFEQSNPFGIKKRAATMTKPVATVYSGADWLIKQEKGGNVQPYKNSFAIPTANVRAKGSTKIIRKALRPKNLVNAFVIVSKRTGARLLMQRKGRGKKKGLVAMYLLVPRIQVNPEHVFYSPIEKVAKRRLRINITNGIINSLREIK